MLFQTGGGCGQGVEFGSLCITLETSVPGKGSSGSGCEWQLAGLVVVKQCPFIWSERERRVSTHYIQYTEVGRLGSWIYCHHG